MSAKTTKQNHENRAHSKFSPSSAKRWLACPGSIALCEKLPKPKESPYAKEGTNAHALAEYCLRHNCQPNAAIYKKATGDSGAMPSDMAGAVSVYVDEIRSTLEVLTNPIWRIEERFDLEWFHKGMFGSNDCFVYDLDSKKLWVYDYKHGAGVAVDPDMNEQLMIYALGAIAYVGKTLEVQNVKETILDVELVIVQPRAYGENDGVKRWQTSCKDILFWAHNALKPGLIACENENARLTTGSHCRFCNALAVCPEQIKTACAVARTNFQNIELPSPFNLAPDQIAKILQASDLFSAWAKEVESFAQSQAESGVKIPGFKLVQKRSNRSWINELDAASALETHLGEEAFERKVLSVAQAEKALKKIKVSAEVVLDGLVEKKEAGLTLVHESDKRAEVVPQNAAAVFLIDEDIFT